MERGSASDEAPSAPAWRWFLLGFVLPATFLFWDVFVHGQTFAYRDASHFYYPYYKLIASEWGAGRVPLWNPYENGGEPLAAQPTAAVWYPGKLLFVLPYPLAFKLYHFLHIVLAWWSAFLCARMLGVSREAAALAGTGYAFSGFVLFQLYNIVFLVGAAWLPLGLACVDRMVRTPTVSAAFGLAAVLAMQILGGDPEVAILTLIVALPYALVYHFGRQGFWWGVGLLCLGHAAVDLGRCLPPFEFTADAYVAPTTKTLALGWLSAALKYPVSLAEEIWNAVREPSELALKVGGKVQTYRFYLGWTGPAAFVAGMVLLARGGGFGALRSNRSVRLLALTAVAAGLLAAVQILPTRDLVSVSDRAAPKAPHEPAAFSFFPLRLVETALPAIFGRQFPTHTRWAPFANLENGLWTASMYLGLPVALLGFAMLRVRRGDPRVVWMTWVFLLMFWLSVGKFGGLYWMFDPNNGLISRPLDAPRDSKMYGVSDGLYRLCEETIPFFGSFRYPEKCFVFCTLALAVLAALGMERRVFATAGFKRFVAASSVVVAAVLGVAWAGQRPFEAFLAGLNAPLASWGPLNGHSAWGYVVQSLVHTIVALTALAALARVGRRAELLLVALVAVDLVAANRWLIVTEDQAAFETKPKLLAVIEEHEAKEAREHPGPREPFRIHRTRNYTPLSFWDNSEVSRTATLNAWERDTLVPKFGVPWRTAYATTTGTMSVYDVEFFFAPWPFTTPERIRLAMANAPPKMTYFPRVGYNLWGAKYFILPAGQPLAHDERGVYTMISEASGIGLPKLATSDPSKDDYVLLHNTEAFPLAWVVHEAEVQAPIFGLRREDRSKTVERLLYRGQDGGVQIWSGGVEYPLHRRVLVETLDTQGALQGAPGAPSAGESVRFVRDDPGRVELEATLDRPGFVVISNTYYRGWKATVDGKEAPILRANRAMQTVPAPAGSHKVVLTYSCRSTLVGGVLSVVSWLAVGVWWWRNRKRPEAVA